MSTKEQVWTKNEMYQEMLSRYGEAELDESGNPKHFLAKVEIDPAKFGAGLPADRSRVAGWRALCGL